jgi:hypothetical protein
VSDVTLAKIVTVAAQRFAADLRRDLPAVARHLERHLRRVPPLAKPTASLVPDAFPSFALAYWMTPEASRSSVSDFQIDVAYSTFSGYYAIRLIDNLTDRDGPVELPALLPAAGYFHWRFLAPYLQHFPSGHEFWMEFHRVWSDQANQTAADALAPDITEEVFRQVSARKFGAAKVPLAAVACHYGIPDGLERWCEFVDTLGAFVQLMNDFLDWRHDADHGINTLLQSESRRRRRPGESHEDWFVREGCAWGCDRVRAEMNDVAERGRSLKSEDAERWIRTRAQRLDQQLAQAAADPLATGEGSSSLGERTSAH